MTKAKMLLMIVESLEWIYNPEEVSSRMHRKYVSKDYMFRGVGKIGEVVHVLKGGKTGGFWSNILEESYISSALFIAPNLSPVSKPLPEILASLKLPLSKLKAIYLAPSVIDFISLVRIYPLPTKEEFASFYFNKSIASQYYNEVYSKVEKVLGLSLDFLKKLSRGKL